MLVEEAMRAWGCKTSDAFGDSPDLADELGQLIADGRKVATCSSLQAWKDEGLAPPSAGDRELVIDGAGRPWVVIEFTEVTQRRFSEVDADFAAAEGEGDGSLQSWRQGHRRFFERTTGFAQDMMLVCCRFRVVHVLERGPNTSS